MLALSVQRLLMASGKAIGCSVIFLCWLCPCRGCLWLPAKQMEVVYYFCAGPVICGRLWGVTSGLRSVVGGVVAKRSSAGTSEECGRASWECLGLGFRIPGSLPMHFVQVFRGNSRNKKGRYSYLPGLHEAMPVLLCDKCSGADLGPSSSRNQQ